MLLFNLGGETYRSSADSVPESTGSSRPSLSSANRSGPSARTPSLHRFNAFIRLCVKLVALSLSNKQTKQIMLQKKTQNSEILNQFFLEIQTIIQEMFH